MMDVLRLQYLDTNVNSYGKELDQTIDFADNLEKIISIDGLKRIDL
jgi:tRNA A37 methylthiotransferase MiaB